MGRCACGIRSAQDPLQPLEAVEREGYLRADFPERGQYIACGGQLHFQARARGGLRAETRAHWADGLPANVFGVERPPARH